MEMRRLSSRSHGLENDGLTWDKLCAPGNVAKLVLALASDEFPADRDRKLGDAGFVALFDRERSFLAATDLPVQTEKFELAREVIRVALQHDAAGLVLGIRRQQSAVPTNSDFALTSALVQACQCLGLACLDLVLVSDGGEYYSFRELGVLRSAGAC